MDNYLHISQNGMDVEITFIGDEDKVDHYKLNDAMEAVGNRAIDIIQNRTLRGVGPSNKDGTRRTLYQSGEMFDSMTVSHEGAGKIVVSCENERCAFHHYGAGDIPATHFFQLASHDKSDLEGVLCWFSGNPTNGL
jgi:phage gpG-like protein